MGGACDGAELVVLIDAGEDHEGAQVASVGAPGLHAAQIGKALDLRRHVGQMGEFGCAQDPLAFKFNQVHCAFHAQCQLKASF
jgi:hypothetical protein